MELGSAERYEARWHNTGQREIRRGSMEKLCYCKGCVLLIWAIAVVVDAMVMALDEGAMNL